jgi:hypothetical protein
MKDFLLIGPGTILAASWFYPFLVSGEIWIPEEPGFTNLDGKLFKTNHSMSWFEVDEETFEERKWNNHNNAYSNGHKYINENAFWYCSLTRRTFPHLELTKAYNPNMYPKLDNYDAIFVKRYRWIPKDYYEDMAVPITYLTIYNPQEYEIVERITDAKLNGKRLFTRLIIRRKQL